MSELRHSEWDWAQSYQYQYREVTRPSPEESVGSFAPSGNLGRRDWVRLLRIHGFPKILPSLEGWLLSSWTSNCQWPGEPYQFLPFLFLTLCWKKLFCSETNGPYLTMYHITKCINFRIWFNPNELTL